MTDLHKLFHVSSIHKLSSRVYLLGDLCRSNMFREWHVISENIGECRIAILALERGSPEQHLVYQDAQGPPINGTGVSIAFDDFGCNVLFCTDKRVRSKVCDT